MKLLKDILYKCPLVDVKGSTNIAIEAIIADSRTVEKQSLFIATKGTQFDSHKHINEVIAKGAVAIICETYPNEIFDIDDVLSY